jgi:hypothetical protein
MKSTSRKSLARAYAAAPTPTHDDISAAAQLLWIERGRPDNQDELIWLEAEQRLLHPTRPPVGFRTQAGTGNTETAMDELDDLYPGGSGDATTSL